MNVIARLVFELAYFEAAVLHFNYYTACAEEEEEEEEEECFINSLVKIENKNI